MGAYDTHLLGPNRSLSKIHRTSSEPSTSTGRAMGNNNTTLVKEATGKLTLTPYSFT